MSLSLSLTTNTELNDSEDSYCHFEGVKYSFAKLQVENGTSFKLYGMESGEETFFSAMKCPVEDIKLCALDGVVIDEVSYTVGYFHSKEHNETVVTLIDENFGEPSCLICSPVAC